MARWLHNLSSHMLKVTKMIRLMSGWFVPFKYNKNSYIRLFCFHYGGGSASAYREWAKDLIDYVDLIAIQLPGRESRFSEPLLDNISDIVNELSLNYPSSG